MARPSRRPLQRQLRCCSECRQAVREVLLVVRPRGRRARIWVHPDSYGVLQLEPDGKTARKVAAPVLPTSDRFTRHRLDRCADDLAARSVAL